MNKRYKKPSEKVQEMIARAVVDKLPLPPTPPQTMGLGASSIIVRSGLLDTLCRLKFLGYSNFRAAGVLKVNHDVVDRFVQTSEYQDAYAQRREFLLNQVGDMMRDRTLEVLMECIEGKVDDMRDKRIRPALRNQIRNELIELGRDLMKGKATGGAEVALRAMYEKAVKRKNADGSETTETYRLQGPPVGAAPPGWPTEPAASGEVAAPEHRPGASSGGERVGEAEGGAGGVGSDGGGGESSVLAEPDSTAEASEPATEGAGEGQ